MTRHTLLVLAAIARVTSATLSASRAGACKTKNEAATTEFIFDLQDKKIQDGLGVSLQLGLLPATFPAVDIAQIAAPCSRGTFGAGSGTAELFGETDNSPPLWARMSGGAGPIVYFASTPKPTAALVWREAYERQKRNGGPITAEFQNGDMMIAVAVYRDGSPVREIVAFLSDLPNDDLAKAWASEALSGVRKPIALFDATARKFSLPPTN